MSWDATPLYFFSWNFVNFRPKEPIKVRIWWNQKSEIWHFDGLLLSKFSAKKSTEELSLLIMKRDVKFKEKLACKFKYDEKFCEFLPNHSKVPKFHFDGLFLSKVYMIFELKIHRSYPSWHWKLVWCTIWINLVIVVSRMAWGIG